MRRLRRKNGTARRSIPTMGFRGALPRRPRGWLHPSFPQGRLAERFQDSGAQRRLRRKKAPHNTLFTKSLSDGWRPQIATPRSPTVGRCSRGRVFHHLLRQGSRTIAVSLPENCSRTFGIDPSPDANPHLVCPCRHDHARPCPPCSGISPGSRCGQEHPGLETMDGTRPRVQLAARFF